MQGGRAVKKQREEIWQEAVFISGKLMGKRIWVKPERPHPELTRTLYPYRGTGSHMINAYQTYILRGQHVFLYVPYEEVELHGNLAYSYPVRLREWVAHPGLLRRTNEAGGYYKICEEAGL